MKHINMKAVTACISAALLSIAPLPKAEASGICMNFDNVALPFVSSSTDIPFQNVILEQDGIKMYLDTYTRGRGIAKNGVEVNKPRWASSNLLRLRKAAVNFYFDYSKLGFYPRSISFRYFDIKKQINVRVDDVLLIDKMPLFRMVNLGRATFKASGTPSLTHSLYGYASIDDYSMHRNVGFQSVLIGGEYLLIDDVCIKP